MKNIDYFMVKSLMRSHKYFFIQLNDLCSLAAVLAIIFILKNSSISFFKDLSDEQFIRFALMSAVETILELIYTFVTPIAVRRFT